MGRSEASLQAFPHHSGGVVHVQHRTRWGSVPEALLEDDRLDLDSRAVAAWLAVKPNNWQISVTALRRRLARKGQSADSIGPDDKVPMLGKDRWQRIASELEAAGYLMRRRTNGPAGQWIWNIVFNPEPAPIGGFAGDGSAVPGEATAGSTSAGHHGHKEVPTEELPIKTTTTTTGHLGRSAQEERGGGEIYNKLAFESSIASIRGPLLAILCKHEIGDLALCQDLLDELAGVLEAGKRGERQAIKLPTAWFQRLTMKARLDDFERMHCRVIQRRRATAAATLPQNTSASRPSTPSPEGRQILAEMKTMLRSARS